MGKYVYKNPVEMKKMYEFYDRALQSMGVPYQESMITTSYGDTHILTVGDQTKPVIVTLHGGNGISPLNIRIFQDLLKHYCLIAPDVIGMPGKSAPYRNLSSSNNDYGIWINEVMTGMQIPSAMFVVSSYSCAMLLSLAAQYPERITKAVLMVPSGITHGPLIPIIHKMSIPFIRYYSHPSPTALDGIMNTMITDGDDLWREFMDLMMSGYRMEMRAPREYKKKELVNFHAPIFLIASQDDVFFPADRVFEIGSQLFQGKVYCKRINGKHLPSPETMTQVCRSIYGFDHTTKELL